MLILHCGTNDLRKDEPEKVAANIARIAIQAKETIRKVAVSSILARDDSDFFERKRVEVNAFLQKLLANKDIDFIEHPVFDTDWEYLLYNDGIHLNEQGTNVLGNAFLNYINNI